MLDQEERPTKSEKTQQLLIIQNVDFFTCKDLAINMAKQLRTRLHGLDLVNVVVFWLFPEVFAKLSFLYRKLSNNFWREITTRS